MRFGVILGLTDLERELSDERWLLSHENVCILASGLTRFHCVSSHVEYFLPE